MPPVKNVDLESALDRVCELGPVFALSLVLAPWQEANVDLSVAENEFVDLETEFVGETQERGLGSVQVIPGWVLVEESTADRAFQVEMVVCSPLGFLGSLVREVIV